MNRYSALATILIIAVSGCSTPQITTYRDTMALNQAPALPSYEAPAKPHAAEENIPVKDKGRFSLSVRDADLRDVFLLLSRDSGINIIADKDVTGKISIDFTGLELNSALYAITRQMGYTFKMDKGFIRVTKPILETRTFRVNYITGKRTSSSTMNAAISTGNTTSAAAGSSTNINISSGGQSGGSSISATSATGQGNVNITTSGTADFWREIRKGLEVLIFGDTKGGSETEGGYSRGDEKTGKKLVISEIAGIILVADYSDSMERIEDFLKDVEKAARKQVMIQAHIIEVSLNDGFKYGIDWNRILVELPNNMDLSLSQNLNLAKNTEPAMTIRLNHYNDLKGMLEILKEQGQVSIISSPKVSTMNNQKAVIKLTTKEVSWVTNSYFNATGEVLLSYTTPQIDEIGLFLDVTPQIDDNGVITMQIHPSISEKIRDSNSPDLKSTKPVIDTREVDTMIKTNNGQTIVIAGLITDKISDGIRSVPLLGDIPIIGAAFKQVVQEKRKSELVILLTPYILTDKSIEDIRKEHEERLRKAGRIFEAVPYIGAAK